MAEEQPPFNKLVDGIVGSAKGPASVRVPPIARLPRTRVAETRERVLQVERYYGHAYEELAEQVVKEVLSTSQPVVRLQFVAQILCDMAEGR